MKRIFDFFVSLILLIILSPLFLVIGITILIDTGRPIYFKQFRVGKDNKLFYVYKFRTMFKNTRNTSTHDLKEADLSITKTGRFLRLTSLDELPQLINILKGEMSFVGPRPLIPEEKEIRSLRLKYNVYSVRPGMTGLAQINGRDLLSDEEKAAFDKEYVESYSLLLDLKILIKTVFSVIKRENIIEGSEKNNKR